MKSLLTITISLLLLFSLQAQHEGACDPDSIYWSVGSEFDIIWDVGRENRLPKAEVFEMAGQALQVQLNYKIDENRNLELKKAIHFPEMAEKKDTAYFVNEGQPEITINGIEFGGTPISKISIDGNICFTYQAIQGVVIKRTLFPSPSQPLLVEYWELKNYGPQNRYLTFKQQPSCGDTLTSKSGSKFMVEVTSDARPDMSLKANEMYRFAIYYTAKTEGVAPAIKDAEFTLMERTVFLQEIGAEALLVTPEPLFNTAFELAKIKSAEKALHTPDIVDTTLEANIQGLSILEGLKSDKITEARNELLDYTCHQLLGPNAAHFPDEGTIAGRPTATLYCRLFTEGYFGITETDEFGVLRFKPRMPSGWKEMELQGYKAFGETINLRLSKSRRYRGMYYFYVERDGIVLFRKRIQSGRSMKVYVVSER